MGYRAWDKLSYIATAIGVPVLAAAGLVLSWRSYSDTSRAQAQSSAATMFLEYLKATRDPTNAEYLAPTDTLFLCNSGYQQYAAYALEVGESIYNLPGEGETWTHTMEGLIRDHGLFVRSDLLPLDEYSAKYQALIKRVNPDAASRAVNCPK